MTREVIAPEEREVFQYFYQMKLTTACRIGIPHDDQHGYALEGAESELRVWRKGRKRMARKGVNRSTLSQQWTTLNNEAGKDRSEVA